MRLWVGSLAALLLTGLFALLAVYLLGDDGPGSGPDGWEEFSEGPYSGRIGPDWVLTYLNLSGEDLSDLPADLPQSVRDVTQRFFQQEDASNVLFVFLDQHDTLATNINILPCETASAAQFVADSRQLIAYYQSFGVEARQIDSIAHNGRTSALLDVDLSDEVDTYQTYLKTGDCYQAATLTTREGDTKQLASFRQFLANLSIDSAELEESARQE